VKLSSTKEWTFPEPCWLGGVHRRAVCRLRTVYSRSMADSAKPHPAALDPEEIVKRLKKVFGRAMTLTERKVFFFPNELVPSETTTPDARF